MFDLLGATASDAAKDRFEANIAVHAVFAFERCVSGFPRIFYTARASVPFFGFACGQRFRFRGLVCRSRVALAQPFEVP